MTSMWRKILTKKYKTRFTQIQWDQRFSVTATLKEKLKDKNATIKTFEIYRYNPETPGIKPALREYKVNINEVKGYMILDVLNFIKSDIDPTLTYRRSCREGICGSCAMNIDGVNALACICKIDDTKTSIKIYPLPHLFVIRDLVCDMTDFFRQYKSIRPYLIRRDKIKTGEQQFAQSIADHHILEGMIDCILCGCCTTSCPAYWWNGDKYLGPATLLQAYRWIADTRDEAHEERLNQLRDAFSVYRCATIFNCTRCCPKGLNPAKAIIKLKLLLSGLNKKKSADMDPLMLHNQQKNQQ